MAEFKPITTQEEFNAAISERLKRETEKYKDYDATKQRLGELEQTVSTLTGEKAELETKVKGYETNSVKMRIAQDLGLPLAFAERLTGDTEEAIRADAQAMADLFQGVRGTPPQYEGNRGSGDMATMLHDLRGV